MLCLRRIHQNPESNKAWEQRVGWITSSQSYRDFDGTSGEPTEFEWNIFQGFDTLQLYGKVKDLLCRLGETPEMFTGRILFISMFNDISCGKKDNEEECLAHAKVVSLYCDQKTMKKNACQMPISFLYMQKVLVQDNGHSLVRVPKRSGIL